MTIILHRSAAKITAPKRQTTGVSNDSPQATKTVITVRIVALGSFNHHAIGYYNGSLPSLISIESLAYDVLSCQAQPPETI